MTEVLTIKLGSTNCYLVKCNEGYLLVDTAYSNKYEQFLEELDKLAVDIQRIKYLLLTHHHDDHAGFARKLVEETDCRVIVHEKAIEALRAGKNEENMKPVNMRTGVVHLIYHGILHRNEEFPPLELSKDDQVIREGEILSLLDIGIDGKVISTPGHCKDSISLLLSDGRTFAGDAAMNFPKVLGAKHRPIYIETIDEVYDSWERLINHGAKEIYPSHGKKIEIRSLMESMALYKAQ